MECKKCKIDKKETDFCFKNKEKGILHCVCKACQKQYKKDYYYKNKQSHYIRNDKTKDKLIQIIKEEKNKGCYMCPESFHPCLEFHHLDRDDKLMNVGLLKNYGSYKKLIEEINKCVILCANCHRKAHYDEIFNNKLLNKLNTSLV